MCVVVEPEAVCVGSSRHHGSIDALARPRAEYGAGVAPLVVFAVAGSGDVGRCSGEYRDVQADGPVRCAVVAGRLCVPVVVQGRGGEVIGSAWSGTVHSEGEATAAATATAAGGGADEVAQQLL